MASADREEKGVPKTPPDDNGTSTDLEKAPSSDNETKQNAPAEEEQRDPNIVDFEGPDDMENPM